MLLVCGVGQAVTMLTVLPLEPLAVRITGIQSKLLYRLRFRSRSKFSLLQQRAIREAQ